MATASSASAATATPKNGVCEVGEFCLYYRGLVFDLYDSDPDFSDDYFPGTNIPVINHTEYVWNHDSYTWYACAERYYRNCGYVPPGGYGYLTRSVSSAFFA